MSVLEKGRVLLSVTGFHPQRWHELLSAEREVVTEPAGKAAVTFRSTSRPPKRLLIPCIFRSVIVSPPLRTGT